MALSHWVATASPCVGQIRIFRRTGSCDSSFDSQTSIDPGTPNAFPHFRRLCCLKCRSVSSLLRKANRLLIRPISALARSRIVQKDQKIEESNSWH